MSYIIKNLKLLLLMSLFLHSNTDNLNNFGHEILNQINPNLKVYDQLHTPQLQKYLKKYETHYLPQVLQLLKKPISISQSIDYPRIKLLLTKEDYSVLLVYINYLEKNNQFDKAIELYHQILKGLSSIKNQAYLITIFSIVIQKKTNDVMKNSLIHYQYSKKMRSNLKNKISPHLTLDTQRWFQTLDYENKYTLKLIENSTEASYDFHHLKSNPNYETIMGLFKSKSKYYINFYHKKRVIAMKKNQLENYYNFMKKERDDLNSFSTKLSFLIDFTQIKLQSLLGFVDINYTPIANYMGRVMSMVATPAIDKTYIDYLKTIEQNKELLGQL